MSKKFKYLSEDPKQLVQQLAMIIHNCRIYNIELDKDVVEEYNKLMSENVLGWRYEE